MAKRVLIVDDAVFMRNMIKDIIAGGDFEIVGEAANGIEAVERYRELKPDLTTMDIVMPFKSGIEATKEILAEDPQAVIIMCSALGQESLVMEAIEAGAADFIVKPFKGEDVLADPLVDFVHINSPIGDHGWMSIAALKAGKHVMCTVPMATTVHECEEIVKLVRETGLKYMMAETVVYSREFLFIKEMYEKGELGKIQYMAASHPQDMEGWPSYWERMIPMHYATHVVSPVLGLLDGRAEYVTCIGSGTVNDEIAGKSGSAFAVEACHIKIKDSDVGAHVWRFR